MLEGVGVAGVGAEVAMTRTMLVAEAVLTTMQDVAQVHFLPFLFTFPSLIGPAQMSPLKTHFEFEVQLPVAS